MDNKVEKVFVLVKKNDKGLFYSREFVWTTDISRATFFKKGERHKKLIDQYEEEYVPINEILILQFAILIAKLGSLGVFTKDILFRLSEETGLDMDTLCDSIGRAQGIINKSKEKVK